ncbi:MAG: hypothetical protein MHM6MM_001324 [Cercozoa sp. M6MM]
MIITSDQLDSAFRDVVEQSRGSACRVLALVAPEVDAMACWQVWSALLENSNISYSMRPVRGFNDMRTVKREQISGVPGRDLRAILMIGCGVTVDLVKFLFDDIVPEHLTVYVVDAHRPVNLQNAHDGNDVVYVLCDSELPHLPEPLKEDTDSEESADDSNDADEHDVQRQKRLEAKLKRREHRERENARRLQRIEAYYAASYYAESCAQVAFQMALALGRHTPLALWMWALGATDQLLHDRIAPSDYKIVADSIMEQAELFRLQQAQHRTAYDDHTAPEESATKRRRVGDLHKVGSILIQQDTRLMLLRHWSLYAAFLNSSFAASKMALWRRNGKEALDELLLAMGVSLREARQPFRSLRKVVRKRVLEQLQKQGSKYGLPRDELFFPSFTRQLRAHETVCAADVVRAVTASFETPRAIAGEDADNNDDWEQRFQGAFDILRSERVESLRSGIEKAKALQQLLVQVGVGIIERRGALQTRGGVRVAVVDRGKQHNKQQAQQKQSSDEDDDKSAFNAITLQALAQPMAASKLALFIQSALRDVLRRRPRPLLLAILDEKREQFLLVGVNEQSGTSNRRNYFGQLFLQAAAEVRAELRHDAFETAMMRVSVEDLGKLLYLLELGHFEYSQFVIDDPYAHRFGGADDQPAPDVDGGNAAGLEDLGDLDDELDVPIDFEENARSSHATRERERAPGPEDSLLDGAGVSLAPTGTMHDDDFNDDIDADDGDDIDFEEY